MKKRIFIMALLMVSLATFTGCDVTSVLMNGLGFIGALPGMIIVTPLLLISSLFMGTKYETNPDTYKKAMKYIDYGTPGNDYFPESIEEYTINKYSYTRYEYLDICVEVFVDITVSETQMDELLTLAYSTEGFLLERDAYYAEGYKEIVYRDVYKGLDEENGNVRWAYIQKVIYNQETNNIVYEYFQTQDSSVYELKDVVYFNHFGIDEAEYKQIYNTAQEEQENSQEKI